MLKRVERIGFSAAWRLRWLKRFGFDFGDDAKSAVAGFFTFAGFIPHFLAEFELLLGVEIVDLFQAGCRSRKRILSFLLDKELVRFYI